MIYEYTEPDIRSGSIEMYGLFTAEFGKPKKVYYPGCGTDLTPGVAFPESSVVFLDPEPWEDVIASHLPKVVFVQRKAEDYSFSSEFDLVINIHSHAPFLHQVKDLKRGGYLIISNKTSDHAFDDVQFELVGVISENRNKDGDHQSYDLLTMGLQIFIEEEAEPEEYSFSNRRKIKAPYYIFRKK